MPEKTQPLNNTKTSGREKDYFLNSKVSIIMSPTNRTPRGADTWPERGGMLISEAFEAYRRVCVFRNQSPKTIETYIVACKHLICFFDDVRISTITFDMVMQWKHWLDKGRSDATVRGYIICLRVVLDHLRRLGYTVLDPELIPVPKRPQKIPTFISAEDVNRLIKEAGLAVRGYSKINRHRNQAIISLLYASGIRASELCQLDRDSIKDGSFTVVGKGGKARLCFIDKRTQDFIDIYLRERNDSIRALFTANQNNCRMTTNNLQSMFRCVSQRAGLTIPVHPHTLRHSFGYNWLVNNGNMRYLQALLGHSSLQTTQVYTTVVDQDLKKVYAEHHTT